MIRRLDVKIVLTLIATVLIPLGFSVYLVAKATDTSLGLGLNTELADQFKSALEIRRQHIEDLKNGMRLRFAGMADSHRLATLVKPPNEPAIRQVLKEFVTGDPMLFTVRLIASDGHVIDSIGAPPTLRRTALMNPVDRCVRYHCFAAATVSPTTA